MGSSKPGQIPVGALIVVAAILLAGVERTLAAAPPQRVVSMNLCTDSMLFELAEPEQIAAVTSLSRDPQVSYFAERSRSVPVNRGLAEEVIALQPDLILTGTHTANGANALLERLGYNVMAFEPALELATFRNSFRRLAGALGAEARAEQLLQAMDERLTEHRSQAPAIRPVAIIYRPNGFSPGYHSLANDMLVAAGFENLARRHGLEYGGFVPLEILVVAGPDFVLLDSRPANAPALADAMLLHPALRPRSQDGGLTRFEIAEKYWTCGGTYLAEAVDRLATLVAR